MSVGHTPSLSLSRGLPFFLYRWLSGYRLTGTIPAQISALIKLKTLWAITSFLIVLVRVFQHFSFNECCSYAPLSHIFKRSAFFLYRSVGANRLIGTIPAQISALVKLQSLWALTSFLNSAGQSLFILVLISVGLVRLFLTFSRQMCCFFRQLGGNQITGTIPEVISTLVKLERLYAQLLFYWVLADSF